jgi:hypothetical protein
MRLRLPAHPLVYGAAFAVIIACSMALDAVDPLVSRDAEAQSEPTAITAEGDLTVPEGAFTLGPDGRKVPVDSALAAATPADPAAAVAPGDGMTTNLGGSDVAVSSVGGSHEIDGPKRKSRRFPAPTPNP